MYIQKRRPYRTRRTSPTAYAFGFIISGIIVIIGPHSIPMHSESTFPLPHPLAAPHQKGTNQVGLHAGSGFLITYYYCRQSRCVAVVKETLSEHTDQARPGIVTSNSCLLCAQKKTYCTAAQLYLTFGRRRYRSRRGPTTRRETSKESLCSTSDKFSCQPITRELAWLIDRRARRKETFR